MVKRKETGIKPVEQYEHRDKERLNNPPVGLVTPNTDPDTGHKKTYQYDPYIDPQLQWAGKAEHTSFEVPTVSLHVHERIDPKTIINTVKKEDTGPKQMSLFVEQEKPLREAIEFYKHKEGWTNRLIAGDSLLIMNSLLEKEAMAGKVQMIYIDPPYGIRYGSNFQPFVNNRDVKDGKDDDLTSEPEMIKAFRDTWELGIHSYLTYIRDRIILSRTLLHESGSIFLQISDENLHHIREIFDEIFSPQNFIAQINFRSMTPLSQKGMASVYDYIIWYAKDKNKMKFRPLFKIRALEDESEFCFLDNGNGKYKKLTLQEISSLSNDEKKRIFKRSVLTSSGYTPSCTYEFEFTGEIYKPLSGKSWRTHKEGMENLINNHRIFVLGRNPYFKQFHSDFPFIQLENSWNDTAAGFSDPKTYVVQTHEKVITRCMLMTTDPSDLVFDPTCGSGTTAKVAESWGRRWITCDTSRVAITLSKQRLMTSLFDYYQLSKPNEGISSGIIYKTIPHITLGSIANNDIPQEEIIYDQPIIDNKIIRITGPFTVEAVPAPFAKSLDDIENEFQTGDESVIRSGETLRQSEWRDELLRSGVRAKGGNKLEFTRVEPLSGTKYIQAEAETKEDTPKRVLVVFGPEHAPLEQRMVEYAWQEARSLCPDILLFCAFQFDDEAAKDIDELTPGVAGMQLLKVQMNTDLQTDDLKKKRNSNESFWLIGQPDVKVLQITEGEHKGLFQVEVMGFDYYNPKNGNVETGNKNNIAMWMLDTDYDDRSLLPSQIFFPMAGESEGWSKLAKNLKAEIDEEKIEAFGGTVSLPFVKKEKIAVKIIDDRGIESLRVIKL
jgi:adenine-specific DNA-methyltransferase